MSGAGWELVFDGRFDAGDGTLDRTRWLPWYLPHWSSRTAAAARFDLDDHGIRLRVDPDQGPWCPEFDGDVRVSSVQTAEFAGPIGSRVGQHPFNVACTVREAQVDERPYAPTTGRVELRARASADPNAMVALWMIGLGDGPGHSGEICVAEIFGRSVSSGGASVGLGVHAFDDPNLTEDFATIDVAFDATDVHEYVSTWGDGRVDFEIDGRSVKTCASAPTYPLALMLGIYRFAPGSGEAVDEGTPTFAVESVLGYRHVAV